MQAQSPTTRFIYRCSFLLWMGFIRVVVATDGSDFSNNLFSDLAPLLALFGERFAQQFISESFTWLDHIIFAMAPLGIITAIVGAIRVGGPPWMRAIIGRARENRGNAEVELMSSTSHEVCELWNGQSVVRTPGRPHVKQLVMLESDKDNEKTFGLYTVEEADLAGAMRREGPRKWIPLKWIQRFLMRLTQPWRKLRRGRPQLHPMDAENPHPTQCSDVIMDETTFKPEAPNILLNLHRGSKLRDLVFAAAVGTVLQVGVLCYSGFATFSRYPEDSTGWGFPLLLTGTILLSAGLIIVSFIIEKSTTEWRWSVATRPSDSDAHKNIYVLWLQKQQVVGDQSFDSFLLQAREKRTSILTSRRSDRLTRSTFTKGYSDIEPTNTASIDRNNSSAISESFVWFDNTQHGNQQSLAITHPDQVQRLRKVKHRYGLQQIGSHRGHSVSRRPLSIRSASPRLEAGEQEHVNNTVNRIAGNYFEFFTLLGTVVGLSGFILQFQGFRGVHWTCPLAQLAATGIMTAIRAWIRRGLLVLPHAERTMVEHEMDWLADRIASQQMRYWPGHSSKSSLFMMELSCRELHDFFSSKNWTTTFAYCGVARMMTEAGPEDFRNEWTQLRGQRAVDIRRRIQHLTRWTEPISKYAVAVGGAIKKVMDTFLESGDRFIWILDISLGGHIYQVRIPIDRYVTETHDHLSNDTTGVSDNRPWKDVSSEIEAVLSLLLFDIKDKAVSTSNQETTQMELGRRSRLMLGPNENGSLRSDLAWWVGNDIMPEEMTELYDKMETFQEEIIVGIRGIREPDQKSLCEVPYRNRPISALSLPFTGATETLLAHHLFSGFMWSVAGMIPYERLAGTPACTARDAFNIHDQETWKFCTIESSRLKPLTKEIQRTGLGTFEEVSLLIIPPLSYLDKLPSESIVDMILQKTRDFEAINQWEKSIKANMELLTFVKRGVTDRTLYRAICILAAFLLKANAVENVRGLLGPLKAALKDSTELKNKTSIRGVVAQLAKLFSWQRRGEAFKHVFEEILEAKVVMEEIKPDEEQELSRLFGCTRWDEDCGWPRGQSRPKQEFHWYTFSDDILGWTRLHHAAVRDIDFYDKFRNDPIELSSEEPKDIWGQTPFHFRAKSCRQWRGPPLDEYTQLNTRDLEGMAPLHWAAKIGNLVMANRLVTSGWEVNIVDKNNKTPLHLAVEAGHQAIAQLLLHFEANVAIPLSDGRKALHIASQDGHGQIVQALLDKKADPDARDICGQTALHYACMNGHTGVVGLLTTVSETMSEVNTVGDTPLHLAAIGNHRDTAKMLCDAKVNISVNNAAGDTPLCSAIRQGHSRIVKVLLDSKIEVSVQQLATNPALLDMIKNDTSLAETILACGSHASGFDDLKEALRGCKEEHLKTTIMKGHHNMVQAFLEQDTPLIDIDLITLAAEYRQYRIVELLLQFRSRRKDRKPLIDEMPRILHHGLDIGMDSRIAIPQFQDPFPGLGRVLWNLIKNAGDTHDFKSAPEFLQDGQDFFLFSARHGYHRVIKGLCSFLHPRLASALLNARQPDSGDTPLILAARHGQKRTVKTLLLCGAEPDCLNRYGNNCMHIAASLGDGTVVTLLANSGSNLEEVTGVRWTVAGLFTLGNHPGFNWNMLQNSSVMGAHDWLDRGRLRQPELVRMRLPRRHWSWHEEQLETSEIEETPDDGDIEEAPDVSDAEGASKASNSEVPSRNCEIEGMGDDPEYEGTVEVPVVEGRPDASEVEEAWEASATKEQPDDPETWIDLDDSDIEQTSQISEASVSSDCSMDSQFAKNFKSLLDFWDANSRAETERRDGRIDLFGARYRIVNGNLFGRTRHEVWQCHAFASTRSTALHLAAQKGQLVAVKGLLKAGANKKAESKRGKTPLDLATAGRGGGDNYVRVQRLLRKR